VDGRVGVLGLDMPVLGREGVLGLVTPVDGRDGVLGLLVGRDGALGRETLGRDGVGRLGALLRLIEGLRLGEGRPPPLNPPLPPPPLPPPPGPRAGTSPTTKTTKQQAAITILIERFIFSPRILWGSVV